jgi:SAM-dependent methyltransferase
MFKPNGSSRLVISSADLEALLYDWHNAHRLIEQQADIAYWLERTTSSTRTLVLGAGTGRVAVPLAGAGVSKVVALDRSLARLGRIAKSPRLARICGDMTQLPVSRDFDDIIVPYSAFQLLPTDADRRRTVQLAATLLAREGSLYIDVSTSFDNRPPTGPSVALTEFCEELGQGVTEIETCSRETDALLIHREFRLHSGDVLCATEERWAYFSAIDFGALFSEAGLTVESIDHGYGSGRSMHRRIFHAGSDRRA